MPKRIIFLILCCSVAYFTSGCATISGPGVSREEIEQAGEELKVKALDYQIKQLVRVANIGYKLAANLPKKESPRAYVYTGLIFSPIDKYVKRLFGLRDDTGIAVLAVLNNSAAQKAGIRKGDIIQSVDGRSFARNSVMLSNYFANSRPEKSFAFLIKRDAQEVSLSLLPQSLPINVKFQMVDLPEVNAAATSDNHILYTYGMVKFAQSDDEIAVVLGHELAHLYRGHVAKMQGAQIINALLTIALGSVAESQSPGSGQVVMQGSQDLTGIFASSYSRGLENEADYFGLQYVYDSGYDIEAGVNVWERFAIEIPASMVSNFLATHPSSPERIVRIQKIIQELKSK